jgi:hypothetical protein
MSSRIGWKRRATPVSASRTLATISGSWSPRNFMVT